MADPPRSHRRDFLSGQAALDRLAAAAEAALDGSPQPEPPDTYLVRIGRRAMACQFETLLNAGQYPHGTVAAMAALDLVEELEAQLTVYRDSSEIMRINREAAAVPVEVEPQLFGLLQQAVELWRETAGAFDITSGPLSKVWGFYRRQGTLPSDSELAAALARVGSQRLELDAARHSLQFNVPGMELNLGAIGKGYALDRAGQLLRQQGVEHFLLHGGQSSVLAGGVHGWREAGDVPDHCWTVAVHDPMRPGHVLAEVRLRNKAIGTSGAGTQFFRHQGRRYGHILDPRDGWPATGTLSSTVVAPTAAEADALATAFYILGPAPTADYCRRHPHIAALLTVGLPDADRVTLEAWNFADDELSLADH
ncbi:MAG: FAD:protein FMN transferase [Pirellulales bacterium]